jgi:hypothetical protein
MVHASLGPAAWLSQPVSQSVSRRSFNAEAQVASRISPCDICDGQNNTETGFSPITWGFPYQHHSTHAP